MDTREMLELIASLMYAKAAECHAKGMTWVSQSARVSQFGAISSDDEAVRFLELLIEDGLVDMVDGLPVVVEYGEPHASLNIRITSQGGDS